MPQRTVADGAARGLSEAPSPRSPESAVSINAAFLFVAVPYAIALKRTSGVVSVAFGGILGGEDGLRQRGAGAALMVLGAAIVVLAGT